MKCDVKDVNQCTKILSIEVPPIMIKESFDRFYEEIKHKAKVPGFRAGKAPRSVLQMHYSKEAHDEVLKRLVTATYQKGLALEKLIPMGYPTFQDIDFSDEKLSYKARIEVKPDLSIKKYKNLTAKRQKVEVTEEEIDGIIASLRERHAKFIPVEDRGIQLGDFAVCDITSHIEGLPPESKQDEWCEIQENDMMKGFASQTVGMKSGDVKDIEISFDNKVPNERLRGKKGIFTVRVKEIKRKELPELTAEFLKDIGGYATTDELRLAIRKDSEARKKAEEEARLERELINKIEKDVKCDLPQSLVERRLESMVQDAINVLIRQGQAAEDAQKQEEELRKQFEGEARRQVKVAFILDKVAQLENIEASNDDCEKRYKQVALQVRQSVEKIKEYYEKNDMVESLLAEIRNQKVIDFIKEQADIR